MAHLLICFFLTISYWHPDKKLLTLSGKQMEISTEPYQTSTRHDARGHVLSSSPELGQEQTQGWFSHKLRVNNKLC